MIISYIFPLENRGFSLKLRRHKIDRFEIQTAVGITFKNIFCKMPTIILKTRVVNLTIWNTTVVSQKLDIPVYIQVPWPPIGTIPKAKRNVLWFVEVNLSILQWNKYQQGISISLPRVRFITKKVSLKISLVYCPFAKCLCSLCILNAKAHNWNNLLGVCSV